MQLELKPGLTPIGAGFGLLALGVAAWLLWIGWRNLEVFPVAGGLDGTLIFAGLPMGLGLLLVGLTLVPPLSAWGTVITLRREGLRYAGRNVFFDANWGRLIYVGPGRRLKGFRSLVIGTRETRVRIDEFFFPSFERLVTFLERVMVKGGQQPIEDEDD